MAVAVVVAGFGVLALWFVGLGLAVAFGVLNWARDRVERGREPFFPVWGMAARRRGLVWRPRAR